MKDISVGEGTVLNESNSNIVEEALKDFLDNGKIDGSKMRDHWFPEIKADVFISHSHRDQTDAKKLAGYLERNFGLNSFIDSCVWGYADDLLKQIDNQYCLNVGRETYSYEKRNGSTSHVHMMLSTALGMMLDTTECVIFMDTPNSITSNDAVKKTQSPWIYYELGLMRLIRKRSPEEHRPRLVEESFANRRSAFALEVEYSVALGDLTQIDASRLNNWLKAWEARAVGDRDVHPLDVLYKIAPGED
ncbi:MAG: hypothetical protein ACLPYZ_01685 [Limisphaerales bacterium]